MDDDSTECLQNPFYEHGVSIVTILQFLLSRNKTGLVIYDHYSKVRNHVTWHGAVRTSFLSIDKSFLSKKRFSRER